MLCQKVDIYKGLQSPKYQEKLRNARLCNNDKNTFHLPRHCDKVTCESAVVWAKTGEILAVGTVGYYG